MALRGTVEGAIGGMPEDIASSAGCRLRLSSMLILLPTSRMSRLGDGDGHPFPRCVGRSPKVVCRPAHIAFNGMSSGSAVGSVERFPRQLKTVQILRDCSTLESAAATHPMHTKNLRGVVTSCHRRIFPGVFKDTDLEGHEHIFDVVGSGRRQHYSYVKSPETAPGPIKERR